MKRSWTAPLVAIGIFCSAFAIFLFLLTQPWVRAQPSVAPAIDPARLEQHVKALSVDFYPRSFDHPVQLHAAAAYIEAQFKAAGATVVIEPVLVDGQRFHNVIARFGPAQGALLVLGAHYDSHARTHAAGVLATTHTPGADDNASGVAGLIELAYALGREPQSRPIELVAYTLEEPPHFRSAHMGSVWHAAALRKAGRDVRLMLSLEMIGTFTDEPGSQKFPIGSMKYLYSDRGDFIALVGKMDNFGITRRVKALMAGASDVPVYSLNGPRLVQGIDYSDHRSYWAQGYPALMVTDTAFQRNRHYHKAGDTYDRLDYRRMAKVVQAVYAVTRFD